MSLRSELRADIADERKGTREYGHQASELRKAGQKREARVVGKIASDERRHGRTVKRIARHLNRGKAR